MNRESLMLILKLFIKIASWNSYLHPQTKKVFIAERLLRLKSNYTNLIAKIDWDSIFGGVRLNPIVFIGQKINKGLQKQSLKTGRLDTMMSCLFRYARNRWKAYQLKNTPEFYYLKSINQ